MVAREVVGELDFGADVEIVDSEVLAHIIPELRLGDEDELALFRLLVHRVGIPELGILAPDIGESAESQAVNAEEVLHSPYECELERGVAAGVAAEGLVHEGELEGVGVVRVVQEVVRAEQEVLAAEAHAAIVLDMCAEVLEDRVLPEIETACDLEIAAADADELAVGVFGVVVVVNEEEGVSPVVSVVALKGGGDMTATEVPESLKVGLRLGSLSEERCGNSCRNEYFFHHLYIW